MDGYSSSSKEKGDPLDRVYLLPVQLGMIAPGEDQPYGIVWAEVLERERHVLEEAGVACELNHHH